MQLPLLPLDANLPLRKLCRTGTFVLRYAGTNLSSWCSQKFSSNSTSISTPQWSPIPWTLLQEGKHFWASQGKC
jgi:hypothetical protein